MHPTEILWLRLGRVQTLRFESLSRTGIGWSGAGTGLVDVSAPQEDVLVWKESGQWRQNGGGEIRFSNTFRWTRAEAGITLEHLRFGEERPVFLFRLMLTSPNEWRDVEPHLCREDKYSALLQLEEDSMKLSWTVLGPRHDESINYFYN